MVFSWKLKVYDRCGHATLTLPAQVLHICLRQSKQVLRVKLVAEFIKDWLIDSVKLISPITEADGFADVSQERSLY